MPCSGDRWFRWHRPHRFGHAGGRRQHRDQFNPIRRRGVRMEASHPIVPDFRNELVLRVRREIDAGTYDSPEMLEAALERLIARLASE